MIREGKIKQVDKFSKIKKNKRTRVINGKDKFLMPGLADMHVHMPELEKIDTLLLMNIAAGVTHIRVMNSKVPQKEIKERIASGQLESPKIYYSHIIKRDETYSGPEADSLMVTIKNQDISFIKLFSLSDESTFDNLVRSAQKYNITICGHYPTYQNEGKTVMVEMEKVLKNKYKSIEHLAGYNGFETNEQLQEAVLLTKKYQVYNCPTLDWDIMAYDLQYPELYKKRLTYRMLPSKYIQKWESRYAEAIDKAGGSDKVTVARDKYKEQFKRKQYILKKLYENDCILLIGGDAGNHFQADGFNVYEEMINWSRIGVDNYTILKSATTNPAMFFNKNGQWGTVETGKDADLVILAKNPLENIENIATITVTITNGKVFHQKKLLEKIIR
ncbi:amidohydrolase family protein [Sinomicrobium sp. FJxs]|uniref:Amidohydrolase family protein n=1 Tax=Sinomicrobium weinanense TaxID=2842200 RepID=A0A926JVH6_9FLAO|nr:amidohydrolase family protein [Sinomicrobium weinanense]